jgi:hypothetical protein
VKTWIALNTPIALSIMALLATHAACTWYLKPMAKYLLCMASKNHYQQAFLVLILLESADLAFIEPQTLICLKSAGRWQLYMQQVHQQ